MLYPKLYNVLNMLKINKTIIKKNKRKMWAIFTSIMYFLFNTICLILNVNPRSYLLVKHNN